MDMAEESRSPQALEGRVAAPDWAKWLVPAILLLVVTGGYWGFSQNHRAKLDEARALAETKQPTADRETNVSAGPPAAEAARRRAEGAVQTVGLPAEPARPLAGAPTPVPAAAFAADGLYAGPICYGPAAADPPRCFRAQATVSRGRIAGQWPGRDPGVTMFLVGEVSGSGEAKIHMHAEKPDGTRISAIDLAGTLKDGRLDATGSFRNGRTASLNWRKSATGSR
jgi:hypothetical protein